MTTVAKADKSRLTIRGLVDGDQYIVREQPGGWFITPEKKHRVKKSGMSAEAFARIYRTPLDTATAAEISANLAATDKAQ
jgi:isocitrate/isopropylmalate dehydrogenase